MVALCIDYTEMMVGASADAIALESGSMEIFAQILVLLELIAYVACLGFGVIIMVHIYYNLICVTFFKKHSTVNNFLVKNYVHFKIKIKFFCREYAHY